MEGSPLLNSLVSDLEDGTVQELLAAERCTTETDKKDYVIAAAVSSLTLSFCQRLSSPSPHLFISPLSHSLVLPVSFLSPHLFIFPLSHSLVFLHSPTSFTTVAVLLTECPGVHRDPTPPPGICREERRSRMAPQERSLRLLTEPREPLM